MKRGIASVFGGVLTSLTLLWNPAASGADQNQAPRVTIQFEPQAPTEAFVKAAAEYDAIWKAESARIVEAMERMTGLRFEEREIKAVVYEGVSFSGSGNAPMRLRASYPAEVKKATLIHEICHRMLGRVRTTAEIDEHRKLFLVLYDIWVTLYGKEFADRNVTVESSRRGLYDYESAWKWALAMSAEERAAKFKTLRGNAVRAVPPLSLDSQVKAVPSSLEWPVNPLNCSRALWT